jgi:hypothetical protein
MIIRATDRELKDFIAACKTLAGGAPSQGSIESVRGKCGIARKSEPDSPGALRAQEINDVREKRSCDTSTPITMIDREPDYLAGGRIRGAVTHHARVTHTFPAF